MNSASSYAADRRSRSFVVTLLKHPRKLLLRRLNFQIHLWAGILVSIYVILIGVSGSILVFGAELSKLENPSPWARLEPAATLADLSVVVDSLQSQFPHTHVVSVMAPTVNEPVFIATLQTRGRLDVACDPLTGRVLGEIPRRPSRLDWVYDLHENLLARRTGRVINGIAAAILALVTLTGLINWWPGLTHWKRAVKIDFRRSWKRVNFDAHSAVGFWSFAFLSLWAATGIYFVWPDKVTQLTEKISPLVNSRPPAVTVQPEDSISRLDFHAMIEQAKVLDPGAKWKGIVFPGSRRSPFQVLMSRGPGVGRDNEDTLFFNPYNSSYISIWKYGVNKSLGDWLIWLQVPLHFGTHWGLVVKCVWALFGLALPTLAVSGSLMYWNRYLGKRWSQLSRCS